MTGYTREDVNFPTVPSPNPLPTGLGTGYREVYVTKVDALGALVYSAYFGGSFHDEGYAIEVVEALGYVRDRVYRVV